MSLSPSADCFNPPVNQQYGELFEISPFLLRTAELYINCCLWSALDRRREGNAKHYIINSCAWACAQHSSTSQSEPTWKQQLRGCSGARTAPRDGKGAAPGRWHREGDRESKPAVHEVNNIWLPSASFGWQLLMQDWQGRVGKLLGPEPESSSFGKRCEGSLLGVPQGIPMEWKVVPTKPPNFHVLCISSTPSCQSYGFLRLWDVLGLESAVAQLSQLLYSRVWQQLWRSRRCSH